MSLRLLPLLLVACAVDVDPATSTTLEPGSSSSASSSAGSSDGDVSSSGDASTGVSTEGETAGVQPPWGEPYSFCKGDCPAPYECIELALGGKVYHQCVADCDFSDPDAGIMCPPTPGGQPFTCFGETLMCVVECSANACPTGMACVPYGEWESICV